MRPNHGARAADLVDEHEVSQARSDSHARELSRGELTQPPLAEPAERESLEALGGTWLQICRRALERESIKHHARAVLQRQ